MKTHTIKSTAAVALMLASVLAYPGPQEDFSAAVKKCDAAGVNAALSAGANVNAAFEDGKNALCWAAFCPDIVKLLLEKGCDPNGGNYPAVIQAASLYSTDALKLILDAGADVNKPGLVDPGVTLKALIANEQKKGKDANKAMIDAWTNALKTLKPTEVYLLPMLVMGTNCTPCLEMALAKGADVSKGVTDGTLIHTFANFGNSQDDRRKACAAGKSMMEGFGLKVPDWYANLPDDRNGTSESILKLLLGKGLDINARNNGNGPIKPQTPLEVALTGGMGSKKEVMLALINNGADVKFVSENWGSMIMQAAQTGFPEVVQAMVEKGADINKEERMFDDKSGQYVNGFTPLTCAAMKDHLDMVKYLVGAGAKTNEGVHGTSYNIKTGCLTTLKGKTAIYYAIENGNMDMVKFLVESGQSWALRVKVNQMKQKSTADYGAVVVTTTRCIADGEYTPSMYAKQLEMDEMKTYLKSKGW